MEKQGKTAKTWKRKPVLIPFVREGQRTTDRQESKSLGILAQSQLRLAVDCRFAEEAKVPAEYQALL